MKQIRCGKILALVLAMMLCMGLMIGCKDDHEEESTQEPEKNITVTVMGGFPGLPGVDATGFYAMDEEQKLWRIEWSDTGALQPNKKYTVRVKDVTPQDPVESGWSPKFKATAVSVTPVA